MYSLTLSPLPLFCLPSLTPSTPSVSHAVLPCLLSLLFSDSFHLLLCLVLSSLLSPFRPVLCDLFTASFCLACSFFLTPAPPVFSDSFTSSFSWSQLTYSFRLLALPTHRLLRSPFYLPPFRPFITHSCLAFLSFFVTLSCFLVVRVLFASICHPLDVSVLLSYIPSRSSGTHRLTFPSFCPILGVAPGS